MAKNSELVIEISPEDESRIKHKEIKLLLREEQFLMNRLQFVASLLLEMQKVSSKESYEEDMILEQMKRDFENWNLTQKTTISRLQKEQASNESELKLLERQIAEKTAMAADVKQQLKDIDDEIVANRKAIKEFEKEIVEEEVVIKKQMEKRSNEALKRRQSDEKVLERYKKEEDEIVAAIQRRVAVRSALQTIK